MSRLPVAGLLAPLLLATCVVMADVGAAPPVLPDLLSVPHPALERMEEAVQQRLRAEREALDRYRNQDDADPETLGLAFAAMGQLYQVYDLTRPAETCFENARRLRPEDFRWPYHLGVLHQLEGDLERARDRLAEAARLAPADLPSHLRLGQVLVELGELDGAEEEFRKVLAADSEMAAAHYGLGRVFYARGDLGDAIQHLEIVLELQPEADSIHHLLGTAYRRLGDVEKARAHLLRNRHTPVSFPDPLVDSLAPLVQSARRHFNAGVDALRRGDHEPAVRHFRDGLAIDPENSLSHYNLGLALVALGRHDEAEGALRRSLELNPDYSYAHYNLGVLLTDDGRVEEAARHFEKAHELDPRDPEAHLEWATALAARGDVQRAVEELRNLVETHPEHAGARLRLASLQARLGRSADARRLLERLLAGDATQRERAEGHLLLGRLADQRGALDEALEHYRQAAEIDPQAKENQLAWGAALGRAGRFAEATIPYQRAAQLAPEDPDVHFGGAMAHILAGQHAEARKALEEGLETLPESPPLTHLLARLLATCPDPAVRDGERALALATRVFEWQQSPDHAETVAMAFAELGRFDEAVEWQRRAIADADASQDGGAAERARNRLARYQSRRPVRAPWQGDD